MDLIGAQWIAACVAPWAVAPHPNFSVADPAAPMILALVADHRIDESERHLANMRPEPQWASPLIAAAVQSVRLGQQQDALDDLRGFALNELLPYGVRGAASLFLAACLSELDRPAEAVDVLTDVIDAVSHERMGQRWQSSWNLLLAVLLLQRAVRRLESGDREQALLDCSRIGPLTSESGSASYEVFEVSRGISWTSDQVQRDIIDAMDLRARELLSASAPLRDDSWVELVRTRPLWLDVRSERRVQSGLAKSITAEYNRIFGSASRAVTFAREDPVVAPVEAGLFNAEISGDFAEITARRALLGKLRLLSRSESTEPLWLQMADGIRLLRQARDGKALDAALRHIRSAGPTAALQESARAALTLFRGIHMVSRHELTVLAAATEVLSADERREALQCAENYRTQWHDSGMSVTDVSNWSRIEASWKCIARLLPGSGHDEQSARSATQLLDLDESPYLVAPVARLVFDAIEWASVSESTRLQWISWARDRQRGELSELAEYILDRLNPSDLRSNRGHYIPESLEFARRILVELQMGVPAELAEVDAAITACIAGVHAVRERAHQHTYGMAAHRAGVLAAALAVRFPRPELVDSILSLLSDPLVAAGDKAGALNQIAAAQEGIPQELGIALEASWPAIQNSAASAFPHDVIDLRSALIRVRSLLDNFRSELFAQEVTELSCGTAVEQLEALRCIIWVDNPSIDPTWSSTLALQLSLSGDPTVKYNGAFAVARQAGSPSAVSKAVIERVQSLLAHDGIMVPLFTLRGLKASQQRGAPRTAEFEQILRRLSEEHPVSAVRVEARELLN